MSIFRLMREDDFYYRIYDSYTGAVPTILRFRGFRIVIWTEDHEPVHVHAFGNGGQVSFWLHCPAGPVTLRYAKNTKASDRRALQSFISDNLDVFCKAWGTLHVDR